MSLIQKQKPIAVENATFALSQVPVMALRLNQISGAGSVTMHIFQSGLTS